MLINHFTMKHIYYIAFLLTGILFACNNTGQKENETVKNYESIKQASWLLGNWQNISPQVTTTEIWNKENDSLFTGKSWVIAGKDTVSSEAINMMQTTEGMFYIPVVKNQNNGQPVKFTLTSSSDHQLIFENPSHDFPQKITYTLINNDSLMAEISGSINGKQSAEQFPMSRVK